MVLPVYSLKITMLIGTDQTSINGISGQRVTFEDKAEAPIILTVSEIENTGKQVQFPLEMTPQFNSLLMIVIILMDL